MATSFLDAFPTTRLATVIASPNSVFRKRILQQFAEGNFHTEEVCGGAAALARVEEGMCRSLVLDRSIEDLDVDELVRLIRARHPKVEIHVLKSLPNEELTAEVTDSAEGAGSLLHPLGSLQEIGIPQQLSSLVAIAAAPPALREEVDPLPGMIGYSAAMRRVYRMTRLVAPRQTTVLLTGETGTGKELVARALHLLSPRSGRPFIVINCAAIPEPLLEAELFGYNRGAFTGAFQSRIGRIQMAHGGTVLLDEIGDLPLSMQAKLLRFLQEGEIQRLGCSDPLQIDVRVIAATNANLPRMVREGRFRDDLYYRLGVFPIEIDPLRLRQEDIGPLSDTFLRIFGQEGQAREKSFSEPAARALTQHPWPGNVRELRQVIERAFILAEEEPVIRPEHFPEPGRCN